VVELKEFKVVPTFVDVDTDEFGFTEFLNFQNMSSIKKRSFDLEFKVKVVQFSKERSISAAAKEFGVHRKRVQEWRKKEAEMGLL